MKLESDPVTDQAAQRIYGKHPENSVLLQRDAQGQHIVVAGNPAGIAGKTKVELVGHGDGAQGGISDLGRPEAQRSGPGSGQKLRDGASGGGGAPVDVKKVTVVGCDTGNCADGPSLASNVGDALQVQGIDASTKGYDARIDLTPEGAKRAVEDGGLGPLSDHYEEATTWYRAMKAENFDFIKKEGKMPEGDGYTGITPSYDYAKSYFNKNDSPQNRLVEFVVDKPLFQYFDGHISPPKAEDGAFSYSLGTQGTPRDPRSKEGLTTRDIFDRELSLKHISYLIGVNVRLDSEAASASGDSSGKPRGVAKSTQSTPIFDGLHGEPAPEGAPKQFADALKQDNPTYSRYKRSELVKVEELVKNDATSPELIEAVKNIPLAKWIKYPTAKVSLIKSASEESRPALLDYFGTPTNFKTESLKPGAGGFIQHTLTWEARRET